MIPLQRMIELLYLEGRPRAAALSSVPMQGSTSHATPSFAASAYGPPASLVVLVRKVLDVG